LVNYPVADWLKNIKFDTAVGVRSSMRWQRLLTSAYPKYTMRSTMACFSPVFESQRMRLSQFHLATVKEIPADAEVVSHNLMCRAGLLRKLAAGTYTWSPLGFGVLRKVEAVVREEMAAAGAIEILMPSIQPRELWEETGRWEKFGGQLLKIKDRK